MPERAKPRVRPVALVRKQPWRKEIVERRGHVRRLLVHHLAGLGLEVAPEFLEHFLPLKAAAGDVVQLLFQLRGIVEVDVALEEALEERGDEPSAFLRNEAALVEPDIFPVL